MSWRKFPIKFYKKEDGTVHYENKFMHGDAKSIEQAFQNLSKIDFNWDMIYFYDDVTDVQLGAFTPAYVDKKHKGMLYLGQVNLSLCIDPETKGEHTVSHLSKHPEDIPKQEAFIKKLKQEAKREEFIKSIKTGLKKIVNFFKPNTFYIDEFIELMNKAEGLNENL